MCNNDDSRFGEKANERPHSDKDLGEDVCGFISTTREIFTWLPVGVSDDDSWKDPVPGPLVTMVADFINQVRQDWLQINKAYIS